MNFDWKDNGFANCPALSTASGDERLFRAWGGHPGRKWGNTDLPGVCFSLDEATSRWHAEMLYSVMEYQNPVLYLTEFRVPAGTPLWIGRVDPGDPRALLGTVSGSQILIERAYVRVVSEVGTKRLPNDLGSWFVHMGKPAGTQ